MLGECGFSLDISLVHHSDKQPHTYKRQFSITNLRFMIMHCKKKPGEPGGHQHIHEENMHTDRPDTARTWTRVWEPLDHRGLNDKTWRPKQKHTSSCKGPLSFMLRLLNSFRVWMLVAWTTYLLFPESLQFLNLVHRLQFLNLVHIFVDLESSKIACEVC